MYPFNVMLMFQDDADADNYRLATPALTTQIPDISNHAAKPIRLTPPLYSEILNLPFTSLEIPTSPPFPSRILLTPPTHIPILERIHIAPTAPLTCTPTKLGEYLQKEAEKAKSIPDILPSFHVDQREGKRNLG